MALAERTDPPPNEPGPGIGRNVFALATGQAFTWTMGLAAAVVIPRGLGPNALGTLVAASSVVSLFGLILGFVTVNYLIREMVARPSEAPSLTGTAIILRVALAPVFLAVIFVYGRVANYGGEQSLILYLIALATVINLAIEPIQAAFQARERMKYVAITNVISQSSMGLVGIVLVLAGIKAVGIAVSALVVAVVALLCNLYWARKYAPIDHRITVEKMRKLARGSLPYMTIGVALLVYTLIDAVILSVMAPAEVVGWYGVCTRLFATLLFVPTILCTASFPRFVAAFETQTDRLWDVTRATVELVLVLGIAVAVATAIGADPVIHLLYGAAYGNAVPVMVILACCLPLMYLGIAFGQVLQAAGRPTALTVMLVIGGVINATLNIVLIPVFQRHYGNGAIGSGLSLLATELFITLAGFIVIGRHILDRGSVSRAARTALAAAVMFAVAWPLRRFGVFALPPAGIAFIVVALLLRVPTEEERAVLTSALARGRQRLGRRGAAATPAVLAAEVPPTTTDDESSP